MKQVCFVTIYLAIALVACRKELPEVSPVEPEPLLAVPPGFPNPAFPDGNELTPARWALGKKLFYDPVMARRTGKSTVA